MGIIRLLLAIAVCNSHFELTALPMVDGHEAVLSFFAVSGFYMAMILDTRNYCARDFYKSRLHGLYPIYIFAVAVSALLLFTLDIHPLVSRKQMLSVLADPAGFFLVIWTTFCTLGQELLFSLDFSNSGHLYFISKEMHSLYNVAFLVQGWSLSLETVFYLIAPFLVLRGDRSIFILSCISLIFRISIVNSSLADQSFFLRFFPADFWLFGFGILSYRFHRSLSEKACLIDCMAFVLLTVLVMTAGFAGKKVEPFLLPVSTIILQPYIFRLLKNVLVDRVIGKITYPFYLLHYTVIGLFEEYSDDPEGWQIFAVSLSAAIVVFIIFNLKSDVFKPWSGSPFGSVDGRFRRIKQNM